MADTYVTVTGNLTDDPELKFTPQGTPVANFRVAVTARVRDGETWKDGDTSFFRVNAWRDQAEHVADSLGKGDRAVIIGRLKSRAWQTADGESRTVVEIEADEVAVSLRWAIAKPQRTHGRRRTEQPAATPPPSAKTTKARGKRAAATKQAGSATGAANSDSAPY